MAKRELSSTLKNLKFMQRTAPRQEEKPKVEEEEQKISPDASFGGAPAVPNRRCIVIMEGNPHPGALKGRMSFQSFNPSIDKLNEEAANPTEECADHQNTRSSDRVYGVSGFRSEDSNVASSGSGSDSDLKRKQPEAEMETPPPQKPQMNASGNDDGGQSSLRNKRKDSHRHQKRERLDWNVLRPPKPQPQRSG